MEKLDLVVALGGVALGVGCCLELNITDPIGGSLCIATCGATAVVLNRQYVKSLNKKSLGTLLTTPLGMELGVVVGSLSFGGLSFVGMGAGLLFGGIIGNYIGNYISKYIDRQKVNDF